MSEEIKKKILKALGNPKEYVVDLGSFNVEAENEEEAVKKAEKMIEEGGWVEICNVEEEID